jgi:hypothetical protein
MIINIHHDIKAIMNEYVKPFLTVLLVVKIPDWLKIVLDSFTSQNISDSAVLITQIGSAVYIILKIVEKIKGYIKKDETK